jgi:ribosomal protein L34
MSAPGADERAEAAMKLNIRNSKLKRLKTTGFRYRQKTRSGRNVIRRRRARGRSLSAH